MKYRFPFNSQDGRYYWMMKYITQQIGNESETNISFIPWGLAAYITPLRMPVDWSTSTVIQTLVANDFSLLLRKRTRVLKPRYPCKVFHIFLNDCFSLKVNFHNFQCNGESLHDGYEHGRSGGSFTQCWGEILRVKNGKWKRREVRTLNFDESSFVWKHWHL